MTWTLAQKDTDAPTVEVEDPSRPVSDFFVEQFGADPDALWLRILETIVEPLVQITLIVAISWVSLSLLKWLAHKTIDRVKDQATVSPLAAPRSFGDVKPKTMSGRHIQRLDALKAVLDSILAVVVWTIALLVILHVTFGVSLAPLLAGAGVAGLALGFGAQDLVKDFISGFFMLAEDQFGVGDVVDVGEATGVVESVSLRTTLIREVTGTLWHIPNGEIRRVGNMSQEWSRALLDIGVAYGADIDHASAVIKSVADEMAGEQRFQELFLDDPEIWGVESLGDSSVLIRLVIKTKPGEQWGISRELRRRIKLALDAAEVEIPFPQRTLWLRTEEAYAEPLTDAAAQGEPRDEASAGGGSNPAADDATPTGSGDPGEAK